MNLFLDDQRFPHNVTWVELPLVEWIIVRNYNEFVNEVLTNGIPNIVSFDHDLGFEHQRDYFNVQKDVDKIIDPLKLNYKKYKQKTGYDAAKWLVEYCIDKNIPFPTYYIHSMNPIGARNIENYIQCYLKSLIK
jgi:hypothetical protein